MCQSDSMRWRRYWFYWFIFFVKSRMNKSYPYWACILNDFFWLKLVDNFKHSLDVSWYAMQWSYFYCHLPNTWVSTASRGPPWSNSYGLWLGSRLTPTAVSSNPNRKQTNFIWEKAVYLALKAFRWNIFWLHCSISDVENFGINGKCSGMILTLNVMICLLLDENKIPGVCLLADKYKRRNT